ncbi:DNA replication/repair protein RecF [Desertibaculum subflavum]|uniref:DNA replication/repair protein RecF n=1 Tax=Desertibaculum subflavum TaxID=2268458 RepID=UPI000E673B0D
MSAAPAFRAGQAVTRLALTDFRSYAALALDLDPAPVVLTGPNGAGKTNLLEALSFLAPGRGFRRVRLGDVTRLGGRGWSVFARIDGPRDAVEIGTGLVPTEEGSVERRAVHIDGADAGGGAALAGVAALDWLTPQMDRLFLESPGGRRRFLDRLVYGMVPNHARHVAAFEKAMRERQQLLRSGGGDAAWLAALETTMAEMGVVVAAARREAMARLDAALAAGEGPFPRAVVAVTGYLEDALAADPAVEVEDRYRAALAGSRSRDAEAGTTALGPHRSDLLARHAAKDMPAERCSTGEQKAILIAIVLANARLTAARRALPPILLLDEIAAHLDTTRREALAQAILSLGSQAWLTGTDAALFEGFRGHARFLTVRDGRLVG